MKNFQEDEIAQPVSFRKPLKIEFYNRLTDFSLMKPISSSSFLYGETSYQMHLAVHLVYSNVNESIWIVKSAVWRRK